jgi:diguanylate cyclase (GGDEF)-like protein
VLLPGTPLESAIALAGDLIASFSSQQLPHAASPIGYVSVSVGITVCGAAESCNPAGLIRVADEALYAAKHAGRNRAVVADVAANNGRCADCPGFALRQA